MKRVLGAVLIALLMLCGHAGAAIEYLPFEKLRDVQGPAVVHVVARTGEPTELRLQSVLTDKTTWRWLIRDSSGTFALSSLFVDMDQYQAMSLSERDFVLNHKECALTIDVSSNGAWKVTAIKGVPEPITAQNIGRVLMLIIGLTGGGIALYLFLNRGERASSASPAVQVQRRRPGILLPLLAILAMLPSHKDRKRNRHQ